VSRTRREILETRVRLMYDRPLITEVEVASSNRTSSGQNSFVRASKGGGGGGEGERTRAMDAMTNLAD